MQLLFQSLPQQRIIKLYLHTAEVKTRLLYVQDHVMVKMSIIDLFGGIC